MDLRWDNPHQESNPPHPSENMFNPQIQDEHDPTLTVEMAIEWAHLGGD